MTTDTADRALLLNAYIDDELDAVDALAFERTLAEHPGLVAERERIEALRASLREKLPREPLPPHLRARIMSSLGLKTQMWSRPWRALAASLALMVISAGLASWLVLQSVTDSAATDSIVDNHLRALMAPQPADVASSDRHTVKPWFNGRIPESPRVVDLIDQGFPLVGGRIDIIRNTPVPVLVYRHKQHLISLTAMGAPAFTLAGTAAATSHRNGYNVLRWRDADIEYWAISDLAVSDLEAFAKAFRAAGP